MKKSLFALSAAVLMLASTGALATGIASGQPTGANHPMVEDIRKVCSTQTRPINNVVSNGSIENIFLVYSDKSTQYGIAQQDALVYQQGLNSKMMERILMVFPFFSVEVHLIVLADSPIRRLEDLQGKRVAEGPDGSGTFVTTQVIKGLTGVSWVASDAGQAESIKMLKAKQLDAVFIVAGAPVKILQTTPGLKLVSIRNPKLDNFKYYSQTMLASNKYEFQKTPVQTYSVDNVLITFAFKNQYQQEIGDLITCLTRNLGKLQSSAEYHAKWRDVNPLDINRIKWPIHPAAEKAIRSNSR